MNTTLHFTLVKKSVVYLLQDLSIARYEVYFQRFINFKRKTLLTTFLRILLENIVPHISALCLIKKSNIKTASNRINFSRANYTGRERHLRTVQDVLRAFS